mmetsp:Transcript_33247/g.49545  ORF Transcript_33247/g.49545 Transcript_33247/m.49545 type:complete len:480 (-) Transcript_33247:603-2042(-)
MTSSPGESEDDSVRSVSDTMSNRNIRVAVVGNVDAGKSTLIGTLTTTVLDDGRGKSRSFITRLIHEIETGRTSSVSSHLLGFKSNGSTVANEHEGSATTTANCRIKQKTEHEIAQEADRVVTLMDLAGHEKYLKTTIRGVSMGMADYALILVNSRQPPTHMTRHHLNLCCVFGIPTIVVLTKVDGCPSHAKRNTKLEMSNMLRSPEIGKRPYVVRNERDVDTVKDKLHTLAPFVEVSSVTGEGLDVLRNLLFSLPKRRHHQKKIGRPFEFLVENIFNVPGVGPVVSGFVNAGKLDIGDIVYIGPLDDGSFVKTTAKSAHVARINVSHITAGQDATIALSLNKEQRQILRNGMVVVAKDEATSTVTFEAEICIMRGEGATIRENYCTMVHILNIKQAARIVAIEVIHAGSNSTMTSVATFDGAGIENEDETILRAGSIAKVHFQFQKRPEHVRKGMRMLFRDGQVRGVGVVTGTVHCLDK